MKDKTVQIGLLILFPVLVFTVLDACFGFQGLYGQDSYAYLDFAQFLSGEKTHSAWTEPFLWPKAYPFLGSIFHHIGLSTHISLRILSLFSFIGSLLLMQTIIKKVYRESGLLFIFLAAATQIYFLRNGFLVMSDALTLLLLLSAVYFFLHYLDNHRWRNLFFLLLFSIAAVFSRYAAGVLLLVPCVYAGSLFMKRLGSAQKVTLVFLLAGLSFCILWFNSQFLNEIKVRASEWSVLNFFQLQAINRDAHQIKVTPNILYIFGNFGHLGYLSFGLLLLPFYRKWKNRTSWFLALSLAVYLLFIGGLATQNYRFLVLSHPFALFLLFPAFSRLIATLKTKRVAGIFMAGVVLFNLAFAVYSFRKTYAVFKLEHEIGSKIKAIEKGESIYSFYVDQSFSSQGIDNQVYNFYEKEYDTFEKGALVIFNSAQFEKQWSGQSVMNNWEKLNELNHLDTIYDFKNNWVLYRIK